jgi:hypothetical protein
MSDGVCEPDRKYSVWPALRSESRSLELTSTKCRCSHPTGSRGHEPTAAQLGTHTELRQTRPEHVPPSHGQPFACSHCSTDNCPYRAAAEHVPSSHGQPLICSHCSKARCPYRATALSAAAEHVLTLHGQPLARSHCSTDKWPPLAARQRQSTCTHCLTPVSTGSHGHGPTAVYCMIADTVPGIE